MTATERATGLAKQVTIDNAMERFRTRERTDAIDRLEAVFSTVAEGEVDDEEEDDSTILPFQAAGSPRSLDVKDHGEAMDPALRTVVDAARGLASKAARMIPDVGEEDASELPCTARRPSDGDRPSIGRAYPESQPRDRRHRVLPGRRLTTTEAGDPSRWPPACWRREGR